MDTPCKIRGVFSFYFYIMFAACLGFFVLVALAFSDLLRGTTSLMSFVIELLFEVAVIIGLYTYFYRLSNKKKIKCNNLEVTISNRYLYTSLNRRNYE